MKANGGKVMRKAGKKLIPALFAAYILLLCAVFFLREPIGRVRINLVPFDTIRTYLTRLSENSSASSKSPKNAVFLPSSFERQRENNARRSDFSKPPESPNAAAS